LKVEDTLTKAEFKFVETSVIFVFNVLETFPMVVFNILDTLIRDVFNLLDTLEMVAFSVLDTLTRFILIVADVLTAETFRFPDTEVRSVATVSIWLFKSAEMLTKPALSFAETLSRAVFVNVLFAI
jgi:hypothetical protein